MLLLTRNMPAQNLFVTPAYEYTPSGVQSTFDFVYVPQELAFDSSGDLFESANDGNIYKYTPNGIQSVFASGLIYPTGLAFTSSGHLIVADRFAGRVYEYTADGAQVATRGAVIDPIGVACNSGGDVFVASEQWGIIVIYSRYGYTTVLSASFSQPEGLAVDSADNLFVADQGAGCIYKVTPGGAMSTFASGLQRPHGLAFDSAGNLFVTDPMAGKIYKFTPGGARSTFATGLTMLMEGLAFQPVSNLAAVVTNGVFQVTVSMPTPYQSTIIQASTDLANWVNIYTNRPPFSFTNSPATALPYCFYRAMLSQ